MASAKKRLIAPTLRLRLYVAGQAPNSLRAIGNSKAICEENFHGRYELEVIDMIVQPRRAVADGIIVTPTLVRISPLPIIRVIGNLNDTVRVSMVLAGP